MIKNYFEQKKREAQRRRKMETAKNVATGTFIGTALGALAGILFAPKSGAETRKDIADKSKEVAENVKHTVSDSIEATKELADKVAKDGKENVAAIQDKKKKLTDEFME